MCHPFACRGLLRMTAIYFQKTTNGNVEYHLVELTTIRETLLKDYKKLEKDILEKRQPFNESTILQLLRYLNNIRESTFQLFEQILLWQKIFVQAKRPKLLNKDYLVDIITSTEFVNSSKIRKYLNFAVMRGNIFMLPLSTGKPKDPVVVSPQIGQEIQLFSNPDMDKLILCYTLLQKSLPKKKFQDILSLSRWIHSIWIPNIQISSTLPSLPPSNRPVSAPSKPRASKVQSPSRSPKKKSLSVNSSELTLKSPTNQQENNPKNVSFSAHSHGDIPSRSSSQPSLLASSNRPLAPLQTQILVSDSENLQSPIIKSSPKKKKDKLPSPVKVTVPSAVSLPTPSTFQSMQLSPNQNTTVLPSLTNFSLSTAQLRDWYLQNQQNS